MTPSTSFTVKLFIILQTPEGNMSYGQRLSRNNKYVSVQPLSTVSVQVIVALDHTHIIHKHTQKHTHTLGMTSLDEASVRLRGLYLTTHKIHNRRISVPPAGFEPTFPGSQRPKKDATTNVKKTKARSSCGKTLVSTYRASQLSDTEDSNLKLHLPKF